MGGARVARDTRRPKELLKGRIKEIHRANTSNTPDNEQVMPIYTYADLFPGSERDYPRSRLDCRRLANPTHAQKLYCGVIGSRTREEFEGYQEQVNDLAARLDLWRPTYDATKTLHKAHKTARDKVPDLDNVPLLRKTTELLDSKNAKQPPNVTEAETLLNRLRAQTDAVHSFVIGWELRDRAQPLYERLLQNKERIGTDSERQALYESNPDALYRAYLLPATTKAEIDESDVVGRLKQAQYTLQRLSDAYLPGVGAAEAVDGGIAAGGISGALTGLAIAPQTVLQSALQAFGDTLRDTRSPEEIRASVRVHDWLDFAVAALIGALAFLLAVPYLDTFGTWQHYLTAFLAGASGSLVVNWTLLPWARSYVGGASAKEAAPDAPKAG